MTLFVPSKESTFIVKCDDPKFSYLADKLSHRTSDIMSARIFHSLEKAQEYADSYSAGDYPIKYTVIPFSPN